MANFARDPYWRAVVSVEVAATPTRKAEIEETCSRCHAPMVACVPKSPDGRVLHYLDQLDEKSFLGLDGVSCTVCHQITSQNLGTDASYTGNFHINNQRIAFGPYADPFVMPMREHAGYTATEGKQILESAICATCHTLVTETLNPDGTATGHALHEQSAYLEWRNSIFNNEGNDPSKHARSCQACHVPVSDTDRKLIRTAIARRPDGRDYPALNTSISVRSPHVCWGQHVPGTTAPG